MVPATLEHIHIHLKKIYSDSSIGLGLWTWLPLLPSRVLNIVYEKVGGMWDLA